ncbi:MAG: 2-C-methyl-D-erythritol 4-phosphate cytidylyltransferase [Bacteroidota bacterium]
MNYYAIIVAGGSGNRMNNPVPKQFLLLDGIPILMHTIQAFNKSVLNPEILVVLNKNLHADWINLCNKYNFSIHHSLVNGGEHRFHSVQNALAAIEHDGLVAVHDAVRPLVSTALIYKSYLLATKMGNCVAAVSLTDSIRKISADQSTTSMDRTLFKLVQTPQTFQVEILRSVYQTEFDSRFTDDASVAEVKGIKINLIEGERENIKITYPEDIEIASILLKKKRPS